MADIRLYIITDDAAFACLSVFGIGLYGLPEWASIADTVDAINAIPNGSYVLRCWHVETAQSHYMQRIALERWAARELISAPCGWIERIEALIAERDALAVPGAVSGPVSGSVAAEPVHANDASAHDDTPDIARASRWH